MNQKDIKALIELIDKSNISEFKLNEKDFSLTIRTNDYVKNSGSATTIVSAPVAAAPVAAPAPAVSAPVVTPAETNVANNENTNTEENNYITFKSPIVGTFYRKPAPEKPAFVKVDDNVNPGTVLCVIEAMKLFNEIESEVSGRIVKVLVDDATPVEYDQALFLIDPA